MRETLPSLTAEAVCFVRASDALRPPDSRIVDDPYARHFLRRTSRALLASMRATPLLDGIVARLSGGLVTYVRCRHRFIDDSLRAALLERGVEQVVVLGAGYDSRAWRFADVLGQTPVFEVDYPSTGRRKARLVASRIPERPPVDLRAVAVDFETQSLEDQLVAAGFVTGRATFFVWEGVSLYLTRDAVKRSLDAMFALGGPGSLLAMDLFQHADQPDLRGTAHRLSGSLLHLLGEPLTFVLHPEDAGAFLARAGWEVRDLAGADELARRYVRGRRAVYPLAYVVEAAWRDPHPEEGV